MPHQGCVLSPLLYTLYTHNGVATFSSNTVVKFAEDPTVVGLVSKNYGEGLPGGGGKTWQDNNLLLDVVKGADSGLWEDAHHLVVHITEDLTWTVHADTLASGEIQGVRTFYTCTSESLLTRSSTAWYGSSAQNERRALQRVVWSA
ncbi:hypothetical protein N1851_028914 [Merluccius polli]|uniref:Reverse transcriptase domain-containing protein n=1 Tax=Merluccius polli TaxID=89951 RepID=A0AA47M874_MERPO|nr:hypothetical protein N1851_028914 [Merluccius polli]